VRLLRRCVYSALIPVCVLVTVGARAPNPAQFKNGNPNPPANEVSRYPNLHCPYFEALPDMVLPPSSSQCHLPEHRLPGALPPGGGDRPDLPDIRLSGPPSRPEIGRSIMFANGGFMLEGSRVACFRSTRNQP